MAYAARKSAKQTNIPIVAPKEGRKPEQKTERAYLNFILGLPTE